MIVYILQVKRIMNTVFYMLRNEFEADDSYTGSEIMKVVLQTIKVDTNSVTSQNYYVQKHCNVQKGELVAFISISASEDQIF